MDTPELCAGIYTIAGDIKIGDPFPPSLYSFRELCEAAGAAGYSGIGILHTDYERARGLKATYEKAAGIVAEPATWIEDTSRFWYRRAGAGGNEFVVVDAATKQKQPAFDHARLASALSAATGRSFGAQTLPVARLSYRKDKQSLEVPIDGTPRNPMLRSMRRTRSA